MLKSQAQKEFKKYLRNPCPTCKKPKGELCDTNSVWVHFTRMVQYDREEQEKLRTKQR